MATLVSRIIPCLWFADDAEEAAQYYVSIFPDSRMGAVTRYGTEGFEFHGRPEGSVMTVDFELDGQPFTALNGGPIFTFSEAVSFQIMCDDQAELDHFWEHLTAGGEEHPCGWLKDRFGLSWQVVPKEWLEMAKDSGSEGFKRAMQAMFPMKKLDLAVLRRAYAGEG